MNRNSHSDALVFFGATRDLAFKKIFPALHALVKRGQLDVPLLGFGLERGHVCTRIQWEYGSPQGIIIPQ